MKWGWAFLGIVALVGMAKAAEADLSTLPYLHDHPEDWPKQVILNAPVPFKVILDGREAGTASVAAQTPVDLVSVADDGLSVKSGTNQALIAPAQTDLWQRVEAIRFDRASQPDPSQDDPAVTLKLPPNSAPAAWYTQRLTEQIGPWLAKYPKSPLFGQMDALRASFEEEMARVGKGEVRRGDRWFTAVEAADRATDFQAEDLIGQIEEAGRDLDPVRLGTLLAQISKYSKNQVHPALVRRALAVTDTVLASMNADGIRQTLEKKKADYIAKKEATEAELRAALNHPVPGFPEPPEPTGYARYGDGLYRPKAIYVLAHHYGTLLKYYPNDTGVYPLLPEDVQAALRAKVYFVQDCDAKIAQIDRNLSGADDDLQKQRDELAEKEKAVAALPLDREDQALAKIQQALALDPVAAAAALKESIVLWPGNRPAAAAAIGQAEAALAAIDPAIADGKIPQAIELDAAAQDLLLLSASSPRHAEAQKKVDALKPELDLAKGIDTAFAQRDYEAVLAARLDNAGETIRKWATGLKNKVIAQKEGSHAALAEAEADLKRLHLQAAVDAFHKAQALWAANPEIAARLRILQIGGAVLALLVVVLLLYIWERLSTFAAYLRYQAAMKGQKKQQQDQPRRRGGKR